MAAEFGGQGIRVICICPNAILETNKISAAITSTAKHLGVSPEQVTAQYTKFDILTGPTLHQVGETAAFLASETGVAFNSHIVDVDCGKLNIL
jgi:NAD(P)-dependent dehydrogenase (short-subunit alcohol dehydrogenase family)